MHSPGLHKANEQNFLANGNGRNGVFIQPKLFINQPNDVYEQEADAVADKVMQMRSEQNTATSFFKPAAGFVQRKCAHCDSEENVQRKETGGAANNAQNLDGYVQNLSGKGQALSPAIKSFFEPRFGYNFNDVRVHTDAAAAQSAHSVNALAYTAGNHIVFNQSQYQPGSDHGKKLLAHELTHVVQQNSKVGKMVQRANIDYRQLTWVDFKGAVPKNAGFDAETFTDIEFQKLSSLAPVYKETATEEECTVTNAKGKDEQRTMTEVEVKLDTSKLKVRPFMSQEKSWAKPIYKSSAVRKQACITETKDDVKQCKENVAKSKKDCKETSDQCKQSIKDGGTVTLTIGDEEITASDKAGCDKLTAACNNSVKETIGSRSIVSDKDCSVNYVGNCEEGKQKMVDDLLKHEQGHFDITNIIAKQLQAKVDAIMSGFSGKTFRECKKGEAMKKAKADAKAVKAQIEALKKSAKEELANMKQTMQETQDRYDSPEEADHSANVARQDAWNEALGKGEFPDSP